MYKLTKVLGKALGLDQSDSESEEQDKPQRKSVKKEKEPQPEQPQQQQQQQPQEEKEEPKPEVNPFLVSDNNALELIKAISSTPSVPRPSVTLDAPSFISVTDDDIDVDLDPELAAAYVSHRSDVEPQKVTIKLQYQHNFTSISEKSQHLLAKLMKPIKVVIMNNYQFHKVMDVFCKHKKLVKADFVLVYNDEPVFLSATPSGIGLSPIGTNLMLVYPRHCYDSIRQQKQQEKEERLKRLKQAKENQEEDEVDISMLPLTQETQQEEQTEETRIILKLRHSDKKEVSFRVKPTSTLGSLVQPYRVQAKIDSNVTIGFEFEGEALDLNMKIEDTELEDEDIVEVKISS
ncbi:ubiquitin-2 like Rad60 SUMO-like-domain-containing protein [Choanephora cucurbitarum]|nr:ubiquitin-2 like Rad60 SUMO-like-domain-containing protein [Choanephora cucurbitarum]